MPDRRRCHAVVFDMDRVSVDREPDRAGDRVIVSTAHAAVLASIAAVVPLAGGV
jgi:hypothetical protein